MKLATFIPAGAGTPVAGEVRGDEAVAFGDGTSVLDRLASGDRTPASGDAWPLAEVTLVAPIPRPPAIYCIGLNYLQHLEETGMERPEQPIVFVKVATAVAPPGGPVRCPAVVKRLDYEGELVLVIGPGDEIAGFTVADDVTARDLQGRELQWTRAKGADTFCPYGPWITTADEVPDAQALRLITHVNGELRQDATTADLIYGPRELVEFIAETNTLEPGDLILTGTPSGVGQGLDPPQYLADGDVVRIEIEGLGVIEHAVEVLVL